MSIPHEVVEGAAKVIWQGPMDAHREQVMRAALEAAYPILAAQVLRDAVEAFPLETITAPDNAVVWLRRRAEELSAK